MPVQQDITFEAAEITADGLPAYRPSDIVRGRIMLVCDRAARTRGIQLWIGCRVHGSGSGDTVDILPERFIYEGDLEVDQVIQAGFETVIPASGPLSYQGKHVKLSWELRLRVDIPIWPDKRYTQPFLVIPRQADR